ncbi:MAG: hypothetical protein WBC33_02150 [Conexibacter sp.]
MKSPPELWAEVSDAASLARHLGEVGEIRITRLEPETAVAWEGERASGTVVLAPAGWGTSVTLTAQPIAAEAPAVAAEPEPEPLPEPDPEPAPAPARKSWLSRLFARTPAEAPQPVPEPALPEPVSEPVATADPLQDVLDGALDSLGAAHHRPFSRG